MVCGVWFVVCGLWCVVCGLWFVVYGWVVVLRGRWWVVVVGTQERRLRGKTTDGCVDPHTIRQHIGVGMTSERNRADGSA